MTKRQLKQKPEVSSVCQNAVYETMSAGLGKHLSLTFSEEGRAKLTRLAPQQKGPEQRGHRQKQEGYLFELESAQSI